MNARMTAPRTRRRATLALALLLVAPGASLGGDEAPTPLAGRLGMTEAELRATFGDALTSAGIERPPALTEQVMEARRQLAARSEGGEIPPTPDPETKPDGLYAGQKRLARKIGQRDVAGAEYELYQGKVYRIRWLLSHRFERPVVDPLVTHLTQRLGEPFYDQLIEGKLGSGRVTVRRAGWQREGRMLEVRQLHPLTGGPLYLTLSDEAAIRTIIAARGAVLPEPDSTGPWWEKPIQRPEILTPKEAEFLLRSFDGVLDQIDF